MKNVDRLFEQIGWNLVLAARLYRRSIDRELQAFGISQAAMTPLRYLARNRMPLRQGALAEVLGIEGPTLVAVLDLLEKDDLIRRVEDASDRRGRLIEITPGGAGLIERIEGRLTETRARLFRGIPARQLEACDAALAQLGDNLRELRAPGANGPIPKPRGDS